VGDSGQSSKFGRFASEDAVVGGLTAVAGQINGGATSNYESGERHADAQKIADHVFKLLIG
jgi:hypothetical protein